jgi:hypothetical protein
MTRSVKIVLGILGFLLLFPVVFGPAVRAYIAVQMHQFSRHAPQPIREVVLPNGGVVQIHGDQVMKNTTVDQRTSFLWKAEYRPGEQAPVEFAGSWRADKDATKAYATGGVIFIVPRGDYYMNGINKILVRTARGKWKEIQMNLADINDGIDPPELTSYLTSVSVEDLGKIKAELGLDRHEMGPSCFVTDFIPNSGELKLVCSTHFGGCRIRFTFSEDGEALHLVSLEKLPSKDSR